MDKISIRFYNDIEVRAIWSEEHQKWLFSAVDVCASISGSTQPRKYWHNLKKKLFAKNIQLSSKIGQLKLRANDKKRYLTDVLDAEMMIEIAKNFPSSKASKFLDWFVYSDNTIDGKSKKKAYDLFESGILDTLDDGSIKCLQQIHSYIFGGLYDFAGQIRTKNISKGGFSFANWEYFEMIFFKINNMPENTFSQIVDKYIEINIAHPFMEGNGRSARIWLDLTLKRKIKKCVDWSKIDKNDYMEAMILSPMDEGKIKQLLSNALSDKVNDREVFMKGIDYSYYYEEN